MRLFLLIFLCFAFSAGINRCRGALSDLLCGEDVGEVHAMRPLIVQVSFVDAVFREKQKRKTLSSITGIK